MEPKNENAKEVVMDYIAALDGRDYAAAERLLNSSIRVKGPAGEGFTLLPLP